MSHLTVSRTSNSLPPPSPSFTLTSPAVFFPRSNTFLWVLSYSRYRFFVSEEGLRHLATMVHEDSGFCTTECGCAIRREEGGVSVGGVRVDIPTADLAQSLTTWALAHAVYGVLFVGKHQKIGQLTYNHICGFRAKEHRMVRKLREMLK